jgi:hypothetical protein
MPSTNDRASIASAAPTIAALLGVSVPKCCEAAPVAAVVEAARREFGGRLAAKCLVFAPDALGDHLRGACPSVFAAFREGAVEVPVRAVNPAKTPVCYASIFTGAPPEVHGIRQYEKPVLKCDTLFDVLARERRRVAIVAVAGSSIDTIFREREIDYFSEKYDGEVAARALELLDADAHDVIVAYIQAYDDTMHKTGPFSDAAIAAASDNAACFGAISNAFDRAWGRYDRALAVLPDHGAHATPTGGSHGEDIPEDMLVHHFYRLERGNG